MNRELVFTGFNRPAYMRESVASWNQAEDIQNWNAFLSLEPSSLQNHMINAFQELRCKSSFPVLNEERLGVLRNPHRALKSSFDRGSEFSVLAEDDIVVSHDVLQYFQWAMNKYKNDESVLAVLAFSRSKKLDYAYDEGSVSRTKVFCPLVWGTWADRWERIIEPNWDLDYSSGMPDGSQAGWDWNMMRVAVREGKDFLYPLHSRSDHIGKFGGTHTSEFSFPESQAETFRQFRAKCSFEEIYVRDERLNDYYPGTN